ALKERRDGHADRRALCRRPPRLIPVTEAETAESSAKFPTGSWSSVMASPARADVSVPASWTRSHSPTALGELAAAEGHHPALLPEWGRVTVTWWTHKIRGLHRNDFITAAETDALAAESAAGCRPRSDRGLAGHAYLGRRESPPV